MSSEKWHAIWNAKTVDKDHGLALEGLMRVAGFASPFGGVQGTEAWQDYVATQARLLGLRAHHTLYEVGCGAGAFLLPLYQAGYRVGGCDFADAMTRIAQDVMPEGAFQTLEAADLALDTTVDVVVANGVFLYFPDQAYAGRVLRGMVLKARRSVGVFDVCDLALKDENLADRRAKMGVEAYEAAYRDLEHLYLARDWFAETLVDLPVTVEIRDQFLAGYGNSRFRYNVYIHLDEHK